MTVIRISTKILLISLFLTLTACFNNPTTPTASILTPTSIPTDKPTPTAEPSATPTPTEEPPAVEGSPLQPLLALTLVIGILVDDSIVVLENIERHLKMKKKPPQAALDGRLVAGLCDTAPHVVGHGADVGADRVWSLGERDP